MKFYHVRGEHRRAKTQGGAANAERLREWVAYLARVLSLSL